MFPYASYFEQIAEKLEYDMYYLPANAVRPISMHFHAEQWQATFEIQG